MQEVQRAPKPHTAIVDLGYRGVEVPGVEIIHRGRIRSLSAKARRLLKRRQAVEPVIGHLKDDCGLRRNWLKGSEGDVLHPVLCAAGYNLRWLMRAVVRLGLKALLVLCCASQSASGTCCLWGWCRIEKTGRQRFLPCDRL